MENFLSLISFSWKIFSDRSIFGNKRRMNSLPVELVNMIIQTNLIELNELEQREELLNYNLINANFNFLTNSILFSNLLINSNQSLTSLMNILSCPIRYSFYPVYSIKFSSTLSLTTDFWDG